MVRNMRVQTYLSGKVRAEDLEEKLHSLEEKMSALMEQRRSRETRECNLKRVLWIRTGELAVLSDFLNKQVNLLNDRP